MNKNIKELANEAGLLTYNPEGVSTKFEKFAELVAAHEREACAMICEKRSKSYMSKKYSTTLLGGYREQFAASQCAEAIRARGKK